MYIGLAEVGGLHHASFYIMQGGSCGTLASVGRQEGIAVLANIKWIMYDMHDMGRAALSMWRHTCRSELFASLLRAPVEFFDEAEVGILTSRLGADCQAVVRCLSTNMNVALRNGLQSVGAHTCPAASRIQ